MSDHNFEKQVQQKLDELKIPPADKVWSSIEVRIRKDKRRRRGLVLLPLLLLLIGGAFYFTGTQFGVADNSLGQKSSSTKTAADKKNSTSEPSTVIKNNLPKAQLDKKASNANALPAEKPSGNTDLIETTAEQKSKDESSDKLKANITAKPKVLDANSLPTRVSRSPRKDLLASKKQTNEQSIISNKERGTNPIPTAEELTDDKKSNDELAAVSNGKQNKDNLTTVDSIEEKQTTDITAIEKTDTAATIEQISEQLTDSSSAITQSDIKTAKKVRLSSKLKWGANLSVGASSMVEGGILDGGLLSGIISEEKALVSDVAFNATTNSAPGNGPVTASYKPSTIERGLSFSAGAFIQKSISRRFALSTGLQYSFYSTHIRVGSRVDSNLSVQNAFGSTSVSRYYMAAAAPVPTTHEYTNRFHFLELPLTAHLQLNRGTKVPILWNAGVSLAYLVATNALHFDGRTGVYYRDNSLFKKLQANLSTGLAISLRNKSPMPIHIGPQIQWGLTNLMKHDVSDKKKLFFFGLSTKVFLNK